MSVKMHPTERLLRRLLHEPAGVADSDRQHVARCRRYLGVLASIGGGAELVDPAPVPQPRARRFRRVVRRPAVAAFAAAIVVTGGGTAAANDWLTISQAEQIAPVSFSTADLVALPDLNAYGDVVVTSDVEVHPVADAAAAAAETGLEVPQVTSPPRGVNGEPVYQVGGAVGATFTFSTDRATEAATEAGKRLPPPPPGLDGTQVRLLAGPATAAIWYRAAGVPSLVVGRAVAPTAVSSGVPFETVRDYLLSLTDLPDDVAARLRTLTADGSTLVLPVPADHLTTSTTEVDGLPATVLTTRDRTLSAVVWADDGVVTAVAGALDADEVLSIARNLG